MQRVLRWSLMLAAVACGVVPQAASAQAASIPLSLDVTVSAAEVVVGETAQVVVKLKSYKGETIPATEPVAVNVHSELSGDASVAFAAGQATADATVRFLRSGVATLVATAPRLTSGSAMVVVKGPAVPSPAVGAEHSAPAAVAGRGLPPHGVASTSAGTAVGAGPVTNGAGGSNVALAVDVLPQHVHPTNAQWRALVLVTAINVTREPIAVGVDVPVYLATDIGTVTPALTQIDAGKARTGQIQVASDRAGNGTLWAWTDTGQLAAAPIEYHAPVPTQLLVKALPSRATNDGRTSVQLTVFLADETAMTASADQDVLVSLTSSVGAPSPTEVSIPKGKFFGEAVLTSPISGTAEITATSARLKPGSAQTEFVFPLLLVVLAGIGGLIGSVVRSGRQIFTGAWWWHVTGSVGLGIVLGLVFYVLAMFGIIASIPKLSIPLAQLPTTNDLGALVLGFLGGYYARAWLPDLGAA